MTIDQHTLKKRLCLHGHGGMHDKTEEATIMATLGNWDKKDQGSFCETSAGFSLEPLVVRTNSSTNSKGGANRLFD